MKELSISLSINDLNLILEALGQQPYVRVYELIEKVQVQAKAQLNGSAGSVDLNKAVSPQDFKTKAIASTTAEQAG